MLRRLFLFTLTFTYLVTTAGISVAAHFCGSNLKSLSFYSAKAKSCSCKTKSKKKKGCCNSHNTFIKIYAAHHAPSNDKPSTPKVITCFITGSSFLSEELSGGEKIFTSLKSPPFSSTPSYIQIRTLRL